MSTIPSISSNLLEKSIPLYASSSSINPPPFCKLPKENFLNIPQCGTHGFSFAFASSTKVMDLTHDPPYVPGKSPPEVRTAPPSHSPGVPPEVPRTPNVPDFDPIPPEKPADPPPLGPGPPDPVPPKPEAPPPPGGPEVIPPNGPEVTPAKTKEPGPSHPKQPDVPPPSWAKWA